MRVPGGTLLLRSESNRLVRTVLFTSVILIGILLEIVKPTSDAPRFFLAALVLVGLLISLPLTERLYRVVGGLLYVSGTLLLVTADASLSVWVNGITELVVMFAMVMGLPILGIPLILGGYAVTFTRLFDRFVRTPQGRYQATSWLTFCLCQLMAMGAVPIIYALLRNTAERTSRQPTRFLTAALLRGFAWSDIASPLSMGIILAVYITGGSWVGILPIGLVMFVGGVLFNYLLERSFLRMESVAEMSLEKSPAVEESRVVLPTGLREGTLGRMLELVVVLVIMGVLVNKGPETTGISGPYILTGVAIFISAVWSLYLRQPRAYLRKLGDHGERIIGEGHNLFFVFIASGFFATAAAIHPGHRTFVGWLVQFSNFAGPELAILAVPLLELSITFVGVHPLAMAVLLGRVLTPADLGVSVNSFTMAIVMGLSFCLVLSPFSGIANVLANMTGEKPWQICTRWNGRYGLAWIALGLFSLYLFTRWGL